MMIEPSKDQLKAIKALLSYQFDEKVAKSFIAQPLMIEVRNRKIRYIYLEGKRIMTLRPTDFCFTISIDAGKIILGSSEPPKYRVEVREDVEYRGDIMGIDVISSDPAIRPGDEVVIVGEGDKILGVGKAKVPGFMMNSMGPGEVVRIREKVDRNE